MYFICFTFAFQILYIYKNILHALWISMFCLNSKIREVLERKPTEGKDRSYFIVSLQVFHALFNFCSKKIKTVHTQTLSSEKIKDKGVWIQRHRAVK